MQHKKLLEPLKKLSPGQMNRLADFIHSPYFNKAEDATRLFDYFKILHPRYTDKNTSVKVIAKAIQCPDDENWIAKRVTRLLYLTERFLALEYSADPVAERIGTIKAYKKLQLPRHFESAATALRKELKNCPFRDFDHLWHVHKLEEEAFEGFDKVIVRTAENPANEVLETLRKFYLTKKLRYMVDAVYRERLLGVSADDSYKKEVKQFIEKYANDSDLYLLIYGNIYLMNAEHTAEAAMKYYKRVKSVLNDFPEIIPDEVLRSICVHLQNFCLSLINKGKKSYLSEFIEIIDFRISRGILLEGGRLNPQLYKNIPGVAMLLGRFDWAESFINNYREDLPQRFRNDYYHFSMGQLFYHKKLFKDSCRHLSEACHNKSDVYFGFAVKKLLLKIGLESNEAPDVLISYINSYRKHMERYRNKIGENGLILEKFFKYYRYLEKARWKQGEMEVVLNSIVEEENFSDKEWLVGMAQKFIKKPVPKEKFFTEV